MENKTTELAWGCTPWDGMTREEMLREIERMYSALTSLYSMVSQTRAIDLEYHGRNEIYWSTEGAGGGAYEKARQIMEPLRGKYEDEIYRSFFRYADDLLFQRNGYRMIGHNWDVCDTCGVMYGESVSGESQTGRRCADIGWRKNCPGTMRKLQWADLAPKPDALPPSAPGEADRDGGVREQALDEHGGTPG